MYPLFLWIFPAECYPLCHVKFGTISITQESRHIRRSTHGVDELLVCCVQLAAYETHNKNYSILVIIPRPFFPATPG